MSTTYYDVGFLLSCAGVIYAMMEVPGLRAVGLITLLLMVILWGSIHAEAEIMGMMERDDQDGEL